MKRAQLNYRTPALATALLLVLVFACKSAFSEGVKAKTDSMSANSILTDNPSGPCDPALGEADLVPGTDVNGNRVAPAGLDGGAVPFKGQIAVPLKAKPGSPAAYVNVDGAKLEPLLNPNSPCK